jgi:hypothetical protein
MYATLLTMVINNQYILIRHSLFNILSKLTMIYTFATNIMFTSAGSIQRGTTQIIHNKNMRIDPFLCDLLRFCHSKSKIHRFLAKVLNTSQLTTCLFEFLNGIYNYKVLLWDGQNAYRHLQWHFTYIVHIPEVCFGWTLYTGRYLSNTMSASSQNRLIQVYLRINGFWLPLLK